MNTIDKIVLERIWVTEYEDSCPVREPSPPIEDSEEPLIDRLYNYPFLLYKK